MQEPLDGLTRIYAEKLLEQTGEEPFPMAKIIAFNLSGCPDSPEAFPRGDEMGGEGTGTFVQPDQPDRSERGDGAVKVSGAAGPLLAGLDALVSHLEAAIGPMGAKREAVAAHYAAFLAKFDAQAEDGRLSKAECAVFATESILEVRCPLFVAHSSSASTPPFCVEFVRGGGGGGV